MTADIDQWLATCQDPCLTTNEAITIVILILPIGTMRHSLTLVWQSPSSVTP